MSSRFAGLKQKAAPVPPAVVAAPTLAAVPQVEQIGQGARILKNPREGKKAVVGYFSPAVSKALHLLAIETDMSIQGLIGEAIDDLMRKHGRHPFGER